MMRNSPNRLTRGILIAVAACLLPVGAAAQCAYTQVTDTTLKVIGNSSPQPMPTGSTINNSLAYTLSSIGNLITQSVAQVQVVNGRVNVCLPAAVYQMSYSVMNPYPLSGVTNYDRTWTIPAPTVDVVDTNGTTVTLSTGTDFTNILVGNNVTIGSTVYPVTAVASTHSLTIGTSAGSQTGVGMRSAGPYLVAQIESAAGSSGPPAVFAVDTPLTYVNSQLGITLPAFPGSTIVGTTDTQSLTNKTVDGVTPLTLSYLDATSSIQSQLNARQLTISSSTAQVITNASGTVQGASTLTYASGALGVNTATPFAQMALIVDFTSTGSPVNQPQWSPGQVVTFGGGGTGTVLGARGSKSAQVGAIVLSTYTGSISGTISAGDSPSTPCATTTVCTVSATTAPSISSGMDARGAINLSGNVLYLQGTPFLYALNPANTRGRDMFLGVGSGNLLMGGTDPQGGLNTGLGAFSLHFCTTCWGNLGVGNNALNALVDGSEDIAIGPDAGENQVHSNQTISIGHLAMSGPGTYSNVIGIGTSVGSQITTGLTDSILIGSSTAVSTGITAGSGDVIIGHNVTGLSPTLTNSVVLADGAGNVKLAFDSGGVATVPGLSVTGFVQATGGVLSSAALTGGQVTTALGYTPQTAITSSANQVLVNNGSVPAGNANLTFNNSLLNVGGGVNAYTMSVIAPGSPPGTVTTTSGSAAVTGIGTHFLSTYMSGDTITANAETHIVSTIGSDTALVTLDNWTGNNSGVSFTPGYPVDGGNTKWVFNASGQADIAGTLPTAGRTYLRFNQRLSNPTSTCPANNVHGGFFQLFVAATTGPLVVQVGSLVGSLIADTTNTLDWTGLPSTGSAGNTGLNGTFGAGGSMAGTVVNASAVSALTSWGTSTGFVTSEWQFHGFDHSTVPGNVTHFAGLGIDGVSGFQNTVYALLGTATQPNGNYAIYDASGLPSVFSNTVAINSLPVTGTSLNISPSPTPHGTITVTAGSPTVTGTGTALGRVFQSGDVITANSESHVVLSIAGETITTQDNWTANATNAPFTASYPVDGNLKWAFNSSGQIDVAGTTPSATRTYLRLNTTLTNPLGTTRGALFQPTIEISNATYTSQASGLTGSIIIGSGNTQNWTSVPAIAFQGNAGLVGIFSTGGSMHGTVTHAAGVASDIQWQSTVGFLTTGTLFHGEANGTANTSITNLAGVAIDPLTGPTNISYLLLGSTSVPTGKYAVYDASGFPSVLSGSLSVTGDFSITNTGANGYSLFGTSIPSRVVGVADKNYFGVANTTTTALEALTAVAEFANNTDTAQATIGGRFGAYTNSTFTGNMTGTTLGGGLKGIRSTIQHNSSALVSLGSVFTGQISNISTGTFTNTSTYHSEPPNVNTGTTWASNSGLWVRGGLAGGGTVTRRFGVRVESLVDGTDACSTVAAGNWGLCVNDQSWFGSTLQMGTLNLFSLPTAKSLGLQTTAADTFTQLRIYPSGVGSASTLQVANGSDISDTSPNNNTIRLTASGNTAQMVTREFGTGSTTGGFTSWLIGEDATTSTMTAINFEFAGAIKGSLSNTGLFTAVSYHETLFTPSSSTATCAAGDFADDVNFHYVCTSTNNWRRAALSSF